MKYLILTLTIFSITSYSQNNSISKFKLHPNTLTLSRLAQPNQYFDKIGPRCGIMGYESGSFECWIWRWKVLRNFEFSFLLGTSTQPILAKDIVKTISVTPEATTLTYAYESFTVKEILVVPRSEPGTILLLDVHTTMPLTIVSSFLPALQPMWPAGIGGQYTRWDDDARAYVISDGAKHAAFLCGSPAGEKMAAPPAHMFADSPIQFKIEVKRDEVQKNFIPIIIAGGEMKLDDVKALYNKLWKNTEKYYQECFDYYQQLRASTMQVVTPDSEFNLAFECGKVALDNLMIINPTLGKGLVAGYGLSGGSARPGFAWFFGGDACINSLAFNSYGGYATVRDAIAFTQKWQRQEDFPIRKKSGGKNEDIGKISHELSQSEGLVDWWNTYPYGYIHADTTPWYIVAMGDYVRWSGDVEFMKKSWKSIKQAYDWCLRKDSDGDGLMDLKGAGLGALEFGKLVGIYADVYTSAIWTQAIKEFITMSELMNEKDSAAKAQDHLKKATAALERKFWVSDPGFYCYGATENNEHVREKTPWPTIGMMWGLFDRSKSKQSLEVFNGADLCTDWGTRSLAHSSSLFEPMNYNYGAAWHFISSFFATAQYKHHFAHAGYSTLQSVVKQVFEYGLGVLPEVYSGETNQKIGEGYHHQGFSTTGYMLPFVRGMLGLEIDALKKKIIFSPHLPPQWNEIEMKHIRVGTSTISLKMRNTGDAIELNISKDGNDNIEMEFSPAIALGTEVQYVAIDNQKMKIEMYSSGQDTHAGLSFKLETKTSVQYKVNRAPEIFLKQLETFPGATNHSLKIISQSLNGKTLRVIVEGIRGEHYTLGVLRAQLIASVKGAQIDGADLIVEIPSMTKNEFARHEIEMNFK